VKSWLIALAIVAAAAPARADDDVEIQRMRFVERGDDLLVTTSIAKLFDAHAYDMLDNGFASTVEIRIWVYPRGTTSGISEILIVRTIVYDLWDEEFTVKLCEVCKPRKVKKQAEAFKLLTELVDEPIAKLADMPEGEDDVFYLAMRLDLNPIDKKTLTEVRRWLSKGTGGGLDRGGAFFGSFVSVFVNPKIADADRVLRLRSQPFYRPRP
jgi:hypothetical protein